MKETEVLSLRIMKSLAWLLLLCVLTSPQSQAGGSRGLVARGSDIRAVEADAIEEPAPEARDPWTIRGRNTSRGQARSSGRGPDCPFWWCGSDGTNYYAVNPCDYAISELAPAAQRRCGIPLVLGGPGPPSTGPSCGFTFARPEGFPASLRDPDYSEFGVSLVNGERVLAETDIAVFDTGGTIDFSRTYRSGVRYDGTLGYGWKHNWDEFVTIGTGSEASCGQIARWVQPGGGQVDFYIDADGEPSNPPTARQRLRRVDETTFEIRDVTGQIKRFSGAGDMFRLQNIRQGSNSLSLTYEDGRLESIRAFGVDRLLLTYDGDGRLERVENGIDSSHWVEYDYTACNELWRVRRPAAALGRAPDGTLLDTAAEPTLQYTYEDAEAGDCLRDDPQAHLLSTVSAWYENPMTSEQGFRTRETVLYDGIHRVAGQCLGSTPCTTPETAEIEYRYAGSDPHTTTIVDRRLGNAEIHELHEYSGSRLERIVEDHGPGGLDRTTTRHYDDDGLLERTDLADGTCRLTEYQQVGGVALPAVDRFRVAERCAGGTTGPPDLVTFRTYDELSGRVRTETGPMAFPDGTIPPDFQPGADPWRAHTTFYDYDVHEGPVDNPEIVELCDAWMLDCDALVLGDVNDHEGDDDNTFGNLVRTRRFVPGDGARPDGYLTQTFSYQSDGRLREVKRADGLRSRLLYYSSSAGHWDWMQSHAIADVAGPGGRGPLGRELRYSVDGAQSFETLQAWTRRGLFFAERDTAGIVVQREFSGSGRPIEETVRCEPVPDSSCPVDGEFLRSTRITYDAWGSPIRSAIRDPATGLVASLNHVSYDELGRPLTVTQDPDPATVPGDPSGAEGFLHLTARTYYDGLGRPVKTVSPEGRVSCVRYDALHRMTRRHWPIAGDNGQSACDEPGPDDPVEIAWYDALDRAIAVTDPEGATDYTWYDAYGREEFSSDGRPDDAFDGSVLLGASPTLPTTYSWYDRSSYDLDGRLTRSLFFGSDGRSDDPGVLHVFWDEMDTLGRVATRTAAIVDGYVPQALAESPGPPQEPGEEVELATSHWMYDAAGRLHRTIDAGGRIVDTEYDDFNRPDLTLAPTSHGTRDTTRTFYDDLGRAWKREATLHDPEGQPHVRTIQVEFDGWSRPRRTVRDPTGENLIVDYDYDALGRTSMVATRWQTAPPALPALHEHDRASKYFYDAAGRRIETHVRDSVTGWSVTRNEYDGDGLPVKLIDPRDNETLWKYDALGRIERKRFPQTAGLVQTVDYLDYDRNGLPWTIQHRRDADDTAMRVGWSLNYDDRGRLIGRSGNVENETPGAAAFAGTIEQVFVHDDLDRIVRAVDRSAEAEFPDETEVVIEREFDSLGRMRFGTQWIPVDGVPVEHRVESVHDNAGFRRELGFPAAFDLQGSPLPPHRLSYIPDDRGRLSTIQAAVDPSDASSARTDLVRLQYVGGRPWLRDYPTSGLELRFHDDGPVAQKMLHYDGLGRVRGMRTVESGAPQNSLADFRYGYDRVGNMTFEQRRHEPVADVPGSYRTRAMDVDHRGRLTQWAEGPLPSDPVPPATVQPSSLLETPSDLEAWTLDDAGNWTSHTSGLGAAASSRLFSNANSLNQYVDVSEDGQSPEPFSYDWLGQMREDVDANRSYVWDLFGRLTEVRNAATGSLISRYRYDAFNRRIQKHTPSPGVAVDATTNFVYDGWRAIEERGVVLDGGVWREIVRARYGFGLGLDQVLWMDRDVPRTVDGEAHPILGNNDGTIDARYFLHHDFGGSVVALTEDGSGDVVERYTYSAYGTPGVYWDATWDGVDYDAGASNLSKVGLPYLYTGQRYDAESGLHYYKNRYLDSRIGRFLRRDLLGYADGPNLYQYAASNPAMFGDQLGLASEEHRAYTATFAVSDPVVRPGGRGRGCHVGVQWRSCREYSEDMMRTGLKPQIGDSDLRGGYHDPLGPTWRGSGGECDDTRGDCAVGRAKAGKPKKKGKLKLPSERERWDEFMDTFHNGVLPLSQDPNHKPPPQTGWNEDDWKWDKHIRPDGRGKWTPRPGTPHDKPAPGGGRPQITWDNDSPKGPHWDVDDGTGKKNRRRFRPDGTEIDGNGDEIAPPELVRPPNWLPETLREPGMLETVAITAGVIAVHTIRFAHALVFN
ncbi:MAG: RHS repeat-associated core domain-containing protein [bacterium]|nr:RHS repeat-associated core domain-containing protein [bacterium]